MRVVLGGNFSWEYHARAKYGVQIRNGLLVIDEDTIFRESNFAQAAPHSPVFDLAPGIRLVLEGCNLLNVTVPDGAEIHGGNLAHVVPAATGDLARPTVNLLHECEKCVTAVREIRERIAARTLPQDEIGRIRHDALKDAFSFRRLDLLKVADDRTACAADNAACMARFGRTVTVALQTALGRGT